jgi:UDPglucose 6-dehydrogenase
MSKRHQITVVRAGYVGMSLAVLLSQRHDVTVLEVDPGRVARINERRSTVLDADIDAFLSKKDLALSVTMDKVAAYEGANFIIIATPTYTEAEFFHSRVVGSVDELKAVSDLIITNRMASELDDVRPKVFTRDLFGVN